MAATSFSFHCMICYEEFDNSVSRYPVVLPCGHTYVCNSCGERIDRCMECRTPLYITFDPNEGKTATGGAANPQANDIRGSPGSWNRSAAAARSRAVTHHSPNPQQQPPKLIKKRIPLPKNVVLLSLIEATELATADVHQQLATKSEDSVEEEPCPPTPEHRPDHKHIIQSMQSLDEEERNEEEKIHLATSLSVGAGGTYAVAAKEGLTMFSQRPPNKAMPMRKQPSVASGGENETDVDELVDDFQRNHIEPKGSHLLDYGDRLQIVAVDKDGWAKLARGYGYVSAENNSVVKVGAAVDKACRLEAMLRIVSQERKRLRKEQHRIDNSFIRLMNELQHSLEKDEDLTVICRSTFTELDTSQNGFELVEHNSIAEEKKENLEHAAATTPRSAPPDMPMPSDPRADSPSSLPFYPPFEKQSQAGDDQIKQTSLMCFSPEELLRPAAITESFSMTEVTASARELLRGVGGGRCGTPTPRSHPNPYPSQSEMLAGARAWRERHGRPAATGIDFRTGMSGHSALLSSKQADPHEFLENDESIRKPLSFRMSSHTGLTMGRKRNSMGNGMAQRSNMWGGNPRASPSTPKTYYSMGTP